MEKVHKPSRELSDAKQLLLGYLDYYRSVVGRKVEGLPESELRASPLPSGWTPLELIKHLTYMERRWFRWGFLAEQLETPRGDEDGSGRWHVGDSETPAELLKALYAGGTRTRAIVEGADLADRAAVGGRFSEVTSAPLSHGRWCKSCKSMPVTPATWMRPENCWMASWANSEAPP